MTNLMQRVNNILKNGPRIIAAAGILYLGSLALTYTTVESYYRKVKKHEPKAAQIKFSHTYNPIKLWQDNRDLIRNGKELMEKNPEVLPIGGPMPVSG